MEENLILKKSVKPVESVVSKYSLVEDQTVPLQKLLDALPVAVIVVDPKGQIQSMNRAAKNLLGKPDPYLKLEDWPQQFGFYLADGKTLYPAEEFILDRALKGETVKGSEDVILRKDGDTKGVWISVSAETLRDENENISAGIALIRDITYRRGIERSRERQLQRIESLYQLSHIIAEADNDLAEIIQLAANFPSEVIGGMSIVTLLNGSKDKLKIEAFRDTEPTRQDLLVQRIVFDVEYDLSESSIGGVVTSGESLLIPSLSPEQRQAVSLPGFTDILVEVGVNSVLIAPLIGRSGVLGTINLFRSADAKPFSTGEQSFLTDICYRIALAIENCRLFDSLREEIARRLSTKRALDMSEERFRSIFESVTLGIKVLGLDGNIFQTNPAFQEMIGYSPEELNGRFFHNFVHPEDIAPALSLFLDVKNKGVTSFRFEHRTLHKDRSVVWVKTFFTVVKKSDGDEEPALIVGIVENVTDQKHREREMAELKDHLENSREVERLRLAQELHDNPMQVLYSVGYRIEELRSKAGPALMEGLKDVGTMIHGVLHDLRALAKELRPPTIFSFGLENAIRSHANDVQEKNPTIKISLSLAHDRQMLPPETRLALFRVLQQLLANVVRHAQATETHIRFQFDAEEAHLEVSDNGKGFEVPSDWIELVREEHYGLAGAAERISALGGTLTVESQPGKFTIVRISIPLKDPDENEN